MRIGLIGAGRIGRLHAANVLAHPKARLAFVADPDGEAARRIAEGHDVPARTDSHEALASVPCDAVMICSPTDTHVDLVERAAALSLAIFCEKPLDLSLDRVARAVEALRRHGVPFMIGFHRRFDPTHRAARDARRDGRIGQLEQMVIVARDPAPPPAEYVRRSGGLFRDMMIHDLDQMRFLSGERFVGVHARGGELTGSGLAALGDIDTATAMFWTERGLVCTIQNSRRAAYGFDQRIELFGAAGAIRIDNPRPTTLAVDDAAGTHATRLFHHFPERYAAAYRAQLDHFVSAVSAGEPPETGIEDARLALVLADAASRSLAEGGPVAIADG